MKLLVVGGAGYVASILRPVIEARYDCWYFDRRPVPGFESRSIVADVNDQEQIDRAVQGAHAILYLAMGTNLTKPRDVHDIDLAFDVNVQGFYRFASAGLSAGAQSVIYASTLSIYGSLFHEPTLDENLPPDAWDSYGLSKRLGESICLAAGQAYPRATVLALRLIQPKNEHDWANAERRAGTHSGLHTGPEDTRELFLAALACNKPGTHIVQASGDVTNRILPNNRVFALLGWKPQGR